MDIMHSKKLCCSLLKIVCSSEIIEFYFPKDECCDMSGAIEIAEYINPKVKLIVTISGDKIDTCYKKNKKTWSAHCLRRTKWISK
jgi:hypothetical protein